MKTITTSQHAKETRELKAQGYIKTAGNVWMHKADAAATAAAIKFYDEHVPAKLEKERLALYAKVNRLWQGKSRKTASAILMKATERIYKKIAVIEAEIEKTLKAEFIK